MDKPQRTATFEQVSSNMMERLGGRVIETVRGPVSMEDMSGFTCFRVDKDGAPYSVALMIYEPDAKGRVGRGFITQMNANSARSIAASLLRLADRIEKVVPNA